MADERIADEPHDPEGAEPPTYTATQVSQGRTVLTTPLRKIIFMGGLALSVIVAAAMVFLGHR